MSAAVIDARLAGTMSPAEFRAFQEGMPDHERWELIGGAPVMMTPPFIPHNRIAGNLERLLNDALDRHDPSRIAVQRCGVELGNPGPNRPEPDVTVIDADYEPGQRYVGRVYLLAEIVLSTDTRITTDLGEPWIDVKRQIYLDHAHCEAVLIVEQDRIDARLDLRRGTEWISQRLTSGADELFLPPFGLRCALADFYDGTPVRPRLVRTRP